MLMFLLADLSSMKPNCLRQPDDDAVSTVRARCALEVDDDEPVKSSRLMLTRCPEGASNNQGRRRLPQMMFSPLGWMEDERNMRSALTETSHVRSGCTTKDKHRMRTNEIRQKMERQPKLLCTTKCYRHKINKMRRHRHWSKSSSVGCSKFKISYVLVLIKLLFWIRKMHFQCQHSTSCTFAYYPSLLKHVQA